MQSSWRTTGTGSCWSSPASGPSTSPAAATPASSSPKSPWTRTPGRPERLAAEAPASLSAPCGAGCDHLDAPETGGSRSPALRRIRTFLTGWYEFAWAWRTHRPFYTGRQRPCLPPARQGRCRASTEKGNAATLAEAKLPLAKKRFVCYTGCILRMERFSERVKAWATDLISTVRNCSGGPALAGLCSAAEFRSLRHLSPCFSI